MLAVADGNNTSKWLKLAFCQKVFFFFPHILNFLSHFRRMSTNAHRIFICLVVKILTLFKPAARPRASVQYVHDVPVNTGLIMLQVLEPALRRVKLRESKGLHGSDLCFLWKLGEWRRSSYPEGTKIKLPNGAWLVSCFYFYNFFFNNVKLIKKRKGQNAKNVWDT